ncbi:MAG: quinol:cytochrome C oxidoreductase [Flammeovirgaceae bacterium]
MAAEVQSYDLDEKFEFSAKLKKNILIIGILGIVLFVIGCIAAMSGGGHGHEAQLLDEVSKSTGTAMAGGGHGDFHWTTRLKANFWINNVFFTGLAVIGVFFFAIQYVAMAGWSVAFLRVFKSFGNFLPIALILMVGGYFLVHHEIFHWTHDYLYDQSNKDTFDAIIDGKKSYFFWPLSPEDHFAFFFVARMVVFLGGWTLFFLILKKNSYAEDLEGGLGRYRKLVRISAGFIVFFAVSSSIGAWDWVMSIDTHWFSTMFGWYVFASWFVAGLAAMTLVITMLKKAGYLPMVNENHLHDMGKFIFAFSIFWTYIWFSQFLLIYYANIPEEGVYFLERLNSDHYGKIIFINLFLNFFFPLLVLMTRDAKRKMAILQIVCIAVIIGHWMDFYLMITPGTLKAHGGFGPLEIGLALIYLAVFAFIVFSNLSKAALVPKNHPMLEECLHHHT